MFHLRFTPYDLSGYTFNFLEVYDKYIVAQEDHDDDGNPLLHYHILIDTDYGIKSIRDAVKASLKIPPAGRGKNNAFYALIPDWKDPGYICKYDNILRSKGFSEAQILEYVISGKKKYLDKVKPSEVQVVSTGSSRSRISVDKEVIADCITFFELAKKKGETPTAEQLVAEACRAVRSYGKGINPYKIREYVLATWFEVGDRELVVKKCLALI